MVKVFYSGHLHHRILYGAVGAGIEYVTVLILEIIRVYFLVQPFTKGKEMVQVLSSGILSAGTGIVKRYLLLPGVVERSLAAFVELLDHAAVGQPRRILFVNIVQLRYYRRIVKTVVKIAQHYDIVRGYTRVSYPQVAVDNLIPANGIQYHLHTMTAGVETEIHRYAVRAGIYGDINGEMRIILGQYRLHAIVEPAVMETYKDDAEMVV